MKKRNIETSRKKWTLMDRMMTAYASVLVSIFTIIIISAVICYGVAREGEFEAVSMICSFVKRYAIYPIGLMSFAGFVLGPEKTADIFSYIWGTHPDMNKPVPKFVEWFIAFLILAGACAVIYAIWR